MPKMTDNEIAGAGCGCLFILLWLLYAGLMLALLAGVVYLVFSLAAAL